MNTATVIIGANYGDEGKGLMTDYLARRLHAGVICRFNGGAQAGHTVQEAGGRRHVFGHVSSGHFAGVPTFLSKDFIVNPLVLSNEANSLGQPKLIVHAHTAARVTTIYDMLINSMAELSRSRRHGSCGLGINETVTRSEHKKYLVQVQDLQKHKADELAEKLKMIRTEWVPARLTALGINTDQFESVVIPGGLQKIPSGWTQVLRSANFTSQAARLIAAADANISMIDRAIVPLHNNVIMEGAQGLGHPP